MKTFDVRFLLSADMNISIEAETEEEARKILYGMTFEELVEEGTENNSGVSDDDYEVVDETRNMVVRVYDLTNEDDEPIDIPDGELTLKITVDNPHGEITEVDIIDAIADELSYEVPEAVGFEYEVII